MLTPILILVGVVLLVLIFTIMRKPDQFQVERSISISATPEAVFAHVQNFHHWKDWSPWAKMDPTMKITYAGPAKGVGAQYEWTGNKKVGQGRMTITESSPSQKLEISLEFIKPVPAKNMTIFTFTQHGTETVVRWLMTGESGLMSKVFQTFMNMDKMVGRDFESGLAGLKHAVDIETR